MNMCFATKLELLANNLVSMSTRCCEKASELRTKILETQDRKAQKQDDYCGFVGQIFKESEKCDLARNRKTLSSGMFKSDPDKLPPPPPPPRIPLIRIWDNDDVPEKFEGNPDTKFVYTKENNNSPEKNKYVCTVCDKIFQDSQEIRNHEGNHRPELYHCLKCNTVSRSERSFHNHFKTHNAEVFTCPEPDCGQYFTLKTSLTNHMQKHSKDVMHCSICNKPFQYWQSCLEHEKFRHRPTQTLECPVCKKMFWTPTSMRSHCSKYRILVSALYMNKY